MAFFPEVVFLIEVFEKRIKGSCGHKTPANINLGFLDFTDSNEFSTMVQGPLPVEIESTTISKEVPLPDLNVSTSADEERDARTRYIKGWPLLLIIIAWVPLPQTHALVS